MLPVKSGDIIELGDLSVQVVEVPSHTVGSIALFEKKKGWLFSGDMVLPWESWAWLHNSATLKQYYDSVNKLDRMCHLIKKVFPSHGQELLKVDGYSRFELPVDIFNIYQIGISNILSGKYEYKEFIYDGLIHGRSTVSIQKRKVTFPVGGIIFDPCRLGI